jgi:hypothetical protein
MLRLCQEREICVVSREGIGYKVRKSSACAGIVVSPRNGRAEITSSGDARFDESNRPTDIPDRDVFRGLRESKLRRYVDHAYAG